MNILIRFLERLFVALVGLITIWFIVNEIFRKLDAKLPIFWAIAITYLISAYLLLPRVVFWTLRLTRQGRIPRFTRARDNLPADPVNILLVGNEHDLIKAFEKAGWHHADPQSFKNNIKMIGSFIRHKPYPTAPFSRLYLFGRKQDYGFQKQINGSPRKRHHVRFWATNINPDISVSDYEYWSKKHKIDFTKPILWVGAGSKDIGLSLTRLTYQVTHAVDKDVDEERDYILQSLRTVDVIQNEQYVSSGKFLVGKYSSDGRIVVAKLKNSEGSFL